MTDLLSKFNWNLPPVAPKVFNNLSKTYPPTFREPSLPKPTPLQQHAATSTKIFPESLNNRFLQSQNSFESFQERSRHEKTSPIQTSSSTDVASAAKKPKINLETYVDEPLPDLDFHFNKKFEVDAQKKREETREPNSVSESDSDLEILSPPTKVKSKDDPRSILDRFASRKGQPKENTKKTIKTRRIRSE